ncbi:hypothetical protein IFR11_15760 [Microbacterium sp. CFBP 8801]|nr:hypothetical protein [Microbacterium sp. CFBP 8801]
MTRDWILALADVARRHPNVAVYLFGSTVHGNRPPNDLDALAVYSTIEEYYAFQEETDRLEFSPLLDVIAMTPHELLGSGFLERSRAVPLYDLVSPNGRGGTWTGQS